jgi:hypothetical protein
VTFKVEGYENEGIAADCTKGYRNTKPDINEEIRRKPIAYIKKYRGSRREALSRRLDELNREWDTERVLEANAAAIITISAVAGLVEKKRGWFLLSGIVGGFLLQHAIQGWCPPLEIIRRFGVRTSQEISNEITAVKYLRGDFSKKTSDPEEILNLSSEK